MRYLSHSDGRAGRRLARLLFLGALLGLLLLAGAVPFLTRTASQGPPILKSVPTDLLELHGIHLAFAGTTGDLVVSPSLAELTARAQQPGGTTIRETVLARVQAGNPIGDAPYDCFCWVVSSMPAEGIAILGPAPITDGEATAIARNRADLQTRMKDAYRIDVIDATTGRWLFADEGARVP